ncbi:hypothetical protein [Photobacterium rosenbergii]|uniref:Uncharacterized protein n=1 Tax=Photobacterium rosenbergii TaxID=294936 RepID=A0ABU3ZFJ6_9GAMM|nr:hypothetical protein [Photobacterium rosenbergii]MDV5168884.1 hypothetical protein [Photobacterium rosenbergii]
MKKVLSLIALVVALLLVGGGSYYGVTVTATIERDGKDNRCSLSSPIFVKVQNNTFSVIRHVTFDLEMFKNGRSQNVLSGSFNRTFDILVNPFSSEAGCFTDSYIKSIIEPNPIDIGSATNKEAILSSLESVKNFREFEGKHVVHISNIQVSYLK